MKKIDYKNVIFLVLIFSIFILPMYFLSMYILKMNAQPRVSAYEYTRAYIGKTVKSIRYERNDVIFTFEDNTSLQLESYSDPIFIK